MAGLLALLVIAAGAGSLAKGRFAYRNFYGQPVFAPYAIMIGLGLVFALLLWRRGR